MSVSDDDELKKNILADAEKLFSLDPIEKERELFSTLTALKPERSWHGRLRDSFFQVIFLHRLTNEGHEWWASRLLSWEQHLDAYFQIADENGKGDRYPGAKSKTTTSPYSVTKHGTERLSLLFDHLKILDGKFSMLLAINSVVVALVGLSLKETTDLFERVRSLHTFGVFWLQWPILLVLTLTIIISFFNIWYAIRGFRRVVWGDLGSTDSADAESREREYARILMLSLARRTNVFRIVANSTRWAIGLFMTFALLAGIMFLSVFVRATPQFDPSSAKCTASPRCCCTDSQQPQLGAAGSNPGTPPATASVTIGSLGLGGDQAKDGLPREATLHLSAGLEAAITRYLNNGSSPAGDSLFSGGRGVALFLLLGAGAGLAAWAIRKRPAVAAPLSAAGLAAAVIKNPEFLSRLGRGSFVYVLIVFSVVMVVLLFLSIMEFFRRYSPRDEEGEEGGTHRTENKAVESPLNIVFSLAVLLWAVIIACYHTEPAAAPPSPPPGPIATTSKVPQVIPLGAISGFQPYSSKIEDLKTYSLTALKTDLRSNGAGPGDLLLLLGSADCTAIHANNMTNEQLAKNRAYTIYEMLSRSGVLMGEKVLTDSLYQHERCRGSEDMRAVFPVLIHMEPGKP